MVKRRMKQRVAVTLACTVWLASIVGASVPSGETTTFSTPRPPGPSPDQYTPLLRSPRYYSQDDYGQDWMNDEPSRIKVANRQEKNPDQNEKAITDSDRSLPLESAANEFLDEKNVEAVEEPAIPYRFQSNDMKTRSELEREAMRLSSIKVAFDEPIESELTDDVSEEDWANDEDLEEDDEMQQDGFVSDVTLEDEGPGSVEVYKLDLYKDRSILSPKPSRKNYLRNKSKIPKKVAAVDQISRKSKDPEESKQHLPKTVSRFDNNTNYFKDRIFGVGGVPELQVGCEGVEASQRQKRSDDEEPAERSSNQSGTHPGPSTRANPLYIEADYDDEEELDPVVGNDELLRLLRKAATTTGSPLGNGNRGDMDPRVKTPADLARPRRKDKFPTRGDLGLSADPNSAQAVRDQGNSSNGNQSQVNPRRGELSAEEKDAENVRSKRSSVWGYGETEGVMNERKRRGHRGARRHREGKRKRRHDGERKRRKAIDKSRQDYLRRREDHIRENPLAASAAGSQPSNLLRQLPTRRDGRNEDYSGRRRNNGQQIPAAKESGKEDRTREELERKLQNYRRRNTPIRTRQSPEDNQRRTQQRDGSRTPNSNNEPPQNIRLPVPPVRYDPGVDKYAQERSRLLEQRQRQVEHTNKAAYEQELRRRQEEQRRQSSERPPDRRQGKSVYQKRSQQEIERLKALPVSAYIFIGQEKPDNNIPKIEDRFGDNEVTYTGLNPASDGRRVPQFPSPATDSPPVAGPSPCVWAIIKCCENPNQRLASCFEARGCQHGHWDDPCTRERRLGALEVVSKMYAG